MKETEIATIGEFGLIEKIKKTATRFHSSTHTGIGDDAALVSYENEFQVITNDLLLEGTHFDLRYMPLKHLGYKAVAANVSDIAAMNAIPQQLLIGMGLSNRFSVEAVMELYDGIRAASEDYKVDMVGGDTVASPSGLMLSVTLMGRVKKGKETKRSTAQVNDFICVTGDLGAAYMGLQILEREKQVFLTNPGLQPQLEAYEYIVGRQLKPHARMDIIYELEEKGVVPTSMIDISDGLASELLHLAYQSKKGVKIFEDKIPIDQRTCVAAYEMKLDPTVCALHGGEDYELLFTISQNDFDKLKNHPDIHFVGHIHPDPKQNVLISKGGNTVPITAQGWKHFE